MLFSDVADLKNESFILGAVILLTKHHISQSSNHPITQLTKQPINKQCAHTHSPHNVLAGVGIISSCRRGVGVRVIIENLKLRHQIK